VTILGGAYLARWLDDPEIINRLGATLSALGAALVLYQTAIELRNEKKRSAEGISSGMMSPADSEVARKIIYERGRARTAERIKIIAAIAIIVFIGELMHGWGANLYRATLGSPESSTNSLHRVFNLRLRRNDKNIITTIGAGDTTILGCGPIAPLVGRPQG
jgi:hypothetical protein